MTVAEAEERISSREAAEWRAVFQLEAEELDRLRGEPGAPAAREHVIAPDPAELTRRLKSWRAARRAAKARA